MHYFGKLSDVNVSQEKMANLKPWERQEYYRVETEPEWYSKYPLHALVEFANNHCWDMPFDFEECALAEFKAGRTLTEKDREGYSVLEYVENNPEAEQALRDLLALAAPPVQLAITEQDELALVTLPASGPSRKFRF